MIIMKAFTLLSFFLHALVTLQQAGGNEPTPAPSSTQIPNLSIDEQCGKQERCDQCIQENPECMWCNDDKGLSLESRRCFSKLSKPIECSSFENPQGAVKEMTDGSGSGNENLRIHPQVVELLLRKGEKRNISLKYTDEKNRPLDLYILMDLSCTMQNHKERVASLSSILAENLRNLTSNLRIGFGSFVDKPLPPFGYLTPNIEKQGTCEGKPIKTFPYGFKNHLKMTDNIEKFMEEVKSAGISFNFDLPEGTLDGLLQSIVCTEQIGWRTGKGSRKLLVISTDGTFHLAGDGKLVGVVLPHDGMCHVDASGMYTHSTILDYPSISLIRQKIRENDVFVIFAVTKDQQSNYAQLSEALRPFAVTQGIDNDNNSITSVIENEYRKLVNTVTLLSEYKHKEHLDIKFYAKCPGESEYVENNQCNGVGPGVSVSFKVEVELKDCPSNKDLWRSNLTVYPQSSSDDIMTINLSMLCECNCEKENPLDLLHTKESSEECSKNGHLRCGICECGAGWGGPYCNCTMGDGGLIDKDQCIDPNTHLVCNERGSCDSCGTCKCDPVNGNPNAIGGKYCECNNTDCLHAASDKGICNKDAEESAHGACICSECVCLDGYSGPRCECKNSDETCRDPKSPNKICNGLGSCQCGNCYCGVANKGKYCEIQHAKINGSCETARRETINCVKCLLSTSDDERSDEDRRKICREECRLIDITFKEKIDRIPVEEEENVCDGTEEDSRNCRIDFIIREKNLINNIIKLEIESGKVVLREKCPTPAPLLEIIIGIIGGMVLFGVGLLLLWKTVTHVQDRREYESFEKAINAASWNTQENPLYKSTTTRFRNPAYLNYDDQKDGEGTD